MAISHKKAMNQLVERRNVLNSLIHRQNLYRNGHRFIDARIENGKLTVQSLESGKREAFEGEGWKNCNNQEVKV